VIVTTPELKKSYVLTFHLQHFLFWAWALDLPKIVFLGESNFRNWWKSVSTLF